MYTEKSEVRLESGEGFLDFNEQMLFIQILNARLWELDPEILIKFQKNRNDPTIDSRILQHLRRLPRDNSVFQIDDDTGIARWKTIMFQVVNRFNCHMYSSTGGLNGTFAKELIGFLGRNHQFSILQINGKDIRHPYDRYCWIFNDDFIHGIRMIDWRPYFSLEDTMRVKSCEQNKQDSLYNHPMVYTTNALAVKNSGRPAPEFRIPISDDTKIDPKFEWGRNLAVIEPAKTMEDPFGYPVEYRPDVYEFSQLYKMFVDSIGTDRR